MERMLFALMVLLSVLWAPRPGLSESGPIMAVGPAKSPADGPSSAPNEKTAQVNRDGSVPPQVMEKLSNAVSSEYIIGAEDMLEITVWRNPDLSKIVQVRPDGRVSMPIIRDIVAVSLNQVNSSNIFVLGEVKNSGKFPLKSKTTLLQGITVAGGFSPTAARNQIVIFRFTENAPGMKRLTASYDEIVLRTGINENFELKSGDTIVVPSEAMVVFPGR